MREPPSTISNDTLVACLRAEFGLGVDGLEFLPIGNDFSAWVYRVRAADQPDYFLKVRAQLHNPASVLIPRFLFSQGVGEVIAPIFTVHGELWAQADTYTLIVYPFITGGTAMQRGMTEPQWTTFGSALRQIHNCAIPPDLTPLLLRETFAPTVSDLLRRIDAHIGDRAFDDPLSSELASFWQSHRTAILTLLERAESLGQQLAATSPALMLCHADIHTNNVLVDTEQRLWITDWDDALLAPRECDLMFVVGGIINGLVGPREEALFFAGYGPTTVDPLALAYYRHIRAVQDIAERGKEVLLRPDLGPDSRRTGVDGLAQLFAPGNIISLAFASAAQFWPT